jgi:hypothetical protein
MPSTILVDLSPVVAASDAAQVVASATLAAKADNTPLPALLTDTVKENHSLAKQNQALAIVIQEMKSREDRDAYWYKELEETNSALYSRIANQHYTIEDLEAQLANNQAELISELQNTITTLQDTITSLEEDVEAASWNEWHKNEEIHRLEEMVDSKNILGLEKALDWERSHNRILRDEMSDVCMKKNREYFELYTQFRICRPAIRWGGKLRKETNICPTTMYPKIYRVWITKHVSDFCGNNVQLYYRSNGNSSPKCESCGVEDALSPLINLGTQHDGRSARTWMKRV